MNQKTVIISEVSVCILVQVTMYLITHFIYADAFRVSYTASLLTPWIVTTLIYWKKETKTFKPRVRWLTVLLLVITISIFIAYKPDYTYAQGKVLAAAQGYENIEELADRTILSFTLKHTRLVRGAYLYAGEKDSIKYYILVSPLDGEIETERIGVGNYIDRYFEMKEGQ